MKRAATFVLAMALGGGVIQGESQAGRAQFREERALIGREKVLRPGAGRPRLPDGQDAASGNGSQQVVIDPQVLAVEEEFERAEAPEQYARVRAHALTLMATADKANQALIAFQAAVIAADSTYFSTPEAKLSQNESWAGAEMRDLHEAALRYTDEVQKDWFGSRRWYERYANLLAASANHLVQGVLPVVHTELDNLCRQLAVDAEKTIPTTFNYRVMVNKWDNVETDTNLARLSWRYGSRNVARKRFEYAIAETRQEGRIDPWLQLEEERYKNERSANPPAVPLQQLREEARLGAQGLRESYSSRAGRIWVNALFDQAYGPMLKDQMWEKGAATPAELFLSTESLKARTLLDEISTPPAELAESDRSAAEAVETDVLGFSRDTSNKDSMFMQESKLISQLSPFGPGGSEGKRLASLEKLEQIYQKGGAGFKQAAKPASLERVQDALQTREAILEYVIPYDPFYPDQYLSIFWITHDGFVPVHLKLDDIIPRDSSNTGSISVDGKAPLTFSPLSVVVATLREEIRSDNDKEARDDLNQLYKVLIQPLVMRGLRLEDYDRLIIVPHGPLHYLPFGALLDDEGKFLVQKTAVTIVPSASVWLLLQERSSPAIRNFVAFGNPLLKRSDLPSLEAAESEVNHIADELDIPGADAKHVFIREQATEERFLRDGPAASLLHLATHGEFPDENALDRHAVMLAAGKSDDGVLSASAIRKLSLASNRLVVLSVCDGGLYRIGPADEPYGLIPAFLQAGSQNAVGTLWKIEDIYGRLLMTEFYKSVLKVGPAEALRQASIEFIRQGQTISRWSGFISVGAGRPFR
jgi:CHAT domain-containing protein